MSIPLAVHLSDGMLDPRWEWGGLALAGALAWWGSRRIREEEITRIALLTAAFFVTSLIHVPVPGGPRTHLLLNGLLGVILGRRALVAIPIGLAMQTALFGHGGYLTLGINSLVMSLPALGVATIFHALRRIAWVRHELIRALFVFLSTTLFLFSLILAGALLRNVTLSRVTLEDIPAAIAWALHPWVGIVGVLVSGLAVWGERRFENAPEFPLGLLLGEGTVLLTVLLNATFLVAGRREGAEWHVLALITVLIHIPLAVLEGVILGFTVGFLAKVKPDLLGMPAEGGVTIPKEVLSLPKALPTDPTQR